MDFFESIRKEWKIISTIFAIIAFGLTAGIRIAHRVDLSQETTQSVQAMQQDDEKTLDDHDSRLDSHEHRLLILEEDERLREKGVCK